MAAHNSEAPDPHKRLIPEEELEWAKELWAEREKNRCPECLVDRAECVCSDPDFRRRKALETKADYMRRNLRIAALRADEESGMLRREDRRIVQGLDAIRDNMDRLVDAIQDLKRATAPGVPSVIFDRLKEIEDSLSFVRGDISAIRDDASAIRVRLD
ncbi:MAG: hypothetical protein OXU63_17810 [Acidobacteriota bacterium]|nr:hypothetical protein [Acidobacteriota bacterium]